MISIGARTPSLVVELTRRLRHPPNFHTLHDATTVALYPPLAERLRQQLMTAPELVRFVNPPNVAGQLYEWEIIEAFKTFEAVKVLKDEQLRRALDDLLEKEQAIELDFQTAYIALPDSEKLMDGFAGYGAGGKNPGFRNILSVCGLEPPS